MMNLIRQYFSGYGWELAFGSFNDSIIDSGIDFKGLNFIKNPYKEKWFADPFILSIDEESIELLVEEYDKRVLKGRIARLVVDRSTYSIIKCDIILELPTHLSFPAIYSDNGIIYVHPENSASGESRIYRYDLEKNELVDPVVLVNEPLTDAVIVKEGCTFIMYSTKLPNNAGPLISLYKSNSLLGPYKKYDSIDFHNKTARMAGAMLRVKGTQIRPAQDCIKDYGEAVIFYDCLAKRGEIRPPKTSIYAGIHTFNTKDNLFVVDLKIYNHPLIRRFVKKILGIK